MNYKSNSIKNKHIKSRAPYIPKSKLTDNPTVTPCKLEWILEMIQSNPKITSTEINKRTGLRATANYYNTLRK